MQFPPPTPNFLAQPPNPFSANPFPTLPQPLNVKLNDNNFLLWKNQLLNAVIANGLRGYLDGTIMPPPQFLDHHQLQPNPAYYAWERYNRLLMCWIYSSLSEEKMGEVVSLETTHDIWSSLTRVYDSKTTARIMGLKTELQNLRKDGSSVSQYLAKIKEIADKFAAVGEPLSYRDHLAHVLDGLGSEYNAFVTSIHNRADSPSLEDVRSLLLAYEARLDKQNTVDQLNIAQANLVNLSLQHNSKRPPPKFSFPNHYKHSFPNSPISAAQSQSILGKPQSVHKWPPKPSSSKIQCQICGKLGHSAAVCYHRTNIAYHNASPQALYHHVQPSPTHPSSGHEFQHPDESWFMDSGATHHMTPDSSILCNPTPYSGGEQVTVGNGSSVQDGSSSGIA
ncbi:uncharacterized protein LOC111022315 [Momordica charantia]|uniref:Uncharacterized protein LOC111022315 n=1 Tax=Momordica charantia TaxID=3673 RepID=A0A6J1DQX7_MOMCH|nr:uncharacterized protein LOC111022315 [Momordica charantia]